MIKKQYLVFLIWLILVHFTHTLITVPSTNDYTLTFNDDGTFTLTTTDPYYNGFDSVSGSNLTTDYSFLSLPKNIQSSYPGYLTNSSDPKTSSVASILDSYGVRSSYSWYNLSYVPDTVRCINPLYNLYTVTFGNESPYLSYFSNNLTCARSLPSYSNSSLICAPFTVNNTLLNSSSSLNSYLSSYSSQYNPFNKLFNSFPYVAIIRSNPSSVSSTSIILSLYINPAFTGLASNNLLYQVNNDTIATLLSISAHRILAQLVHIRETNFITSSGNSRHNNAWVPVVFLWIFVCIAMIFLLLVSSLWTSWLHRGWGKHMRDHPLISWLFLFASLVVLISATTGLLGFVVLVLYFLVYSSMLNLVYCCKRARHREKISNDEDDDDNNNNNSDYSEQRDNTQLNNNNQDHDQKSHEEVALMEQKEEANVGMNGSNGLNGTGPEAGPERGRTGTIIHMIDQNGSNNIKADVNNNNNNNNDSLTPLAKDNGNINNSHSDLNSGTKKRRNRRKELGEKKLWTTSPSRLSRHQLYVFGVVAISFLVAVTVCVAIFGLWHVDTYFIYNRPINQLAVAEYIPQTIAKALFAVYLFNGFANTIRMNTIFADASIDYCGPHYSTSLSRDAKTSFIYVDFVIKYSIDMSQYDPPYYQSYDTVNQWFIRNFKQGLRPVASPNDPNVIVSPAESRVMLWPNVPRDSLIWLKQDNFSPYTLLGSDSGHNISDSHFNMGSVALFRLAPQDYHRFHSPVDGTIIASYSIEGTLHSVSSDAITSENYAIYNQRTVVLIQTAKMGIVGFVAIGALCVGSTTLEPNVQIGNKINRGDKLGYFQFGGSSVAVVFEENAVLFDDDIVNDSKSKTESFIWVNQRIGIRNVDGPYGP